MRTLRRAPATLVKRKAPAKAANGVGSSAEEVVQTGSFHGGLPRMDFGPIPEGKLWQLVHEKRWTYVAVADEDVFAGLAVVSLSYAATAIVIVLDRKTGELLVDRSALGHSGTAKFAYDGPGERSATFQSGRMRMSLGDRRVSVDVVNDGRSELPAHVLLEAVGSGPSPISAIVPIEGGYANATEKRILEVRGEIIANNRRFVLGAAGRRPALAAIDHTAGFLARHTEWRWALGLGYDGAGTRVAFNLVEGFVGEAECGAWVGDTLIPLGEGRFEFDAERPADPWRIKTTCGGADLVFRPAAVHAEDKDMLLVRSKFVQPVGTFEGTLRVGSKTLQLSGVPGVTEHQDVLW